MKTNQEKAAIKWVMLDHCDREVTTDPIGNTVESTGGVCQTSFLSNYGNAKIADTINWRDLPTANQFNLLSDEFTIEFYINPTSNTGQFIIWLITDFTVNDPRGLSLGFSNGDLVVFTKTNTSDKISFNQAYEVNKPLYVTFIANRSVASPCIELYLNGVFRSSISFSSIDTASLLTGKVFKIYELGNWYPTLFDEVAVRTGRAYERTGFTPPTRPFSV